MPDLVLALIVPDAAGTVKGKSGVDALRGWRRWTARGRRRCRRDAGVGRCFQDRHDQQVRHFLASFVTEVTESGGWGSATATVWIAVSVEFRHFWVDPALTPGRPSNAQGHEDSTGRGRPAIGTGSTLRS